MFGPRIKVGWDKLSITLRPFRRKELENFAEMFSSAKVHQYTLQRFGFTVEQEELWVDSNIRDMSQVIWGIVPDETDIPIGVTGLHQIDLYQSCTSGIVICEPSWWGKGVASRANLARTWYGAEALDRATIRSEVMAPNTASKKALERVGYQVTGQNIRCRRHGSQYIDTFLLTWINPIWAPRLFPEGIPQEYAESIERARKALERAKEVIEL